MNLVAWLKSKSITAHTVAALAVTTAGIVASDTQVQQFLVGILAQHPAAAAQGIALAVIIAKYTHSSSPAGTLATARDIKAGPGTPTAKQVDAADTSIKQ